MPGRRGAEFSLIELLAVLAVLADKENFHRPSAEPVQFLYADGHAERPIRFFTD